MSSCLPQPRLLGPGGAPRGPRGAHPPLQQALGAERRPPAALLHGGGAALPAEPLAGAAAGLGGDGGAAEEGVD